MTNRAFTLIELLVVIAIISLLSSIVMTSLGESRNKAKDSAIKAEMASLRSQAELYLSNSGSFGPESWITGPDSCEQSLGNMWDNAEINRIVDSIISKAGVNESGEKQYACANRVNNWEFMAQMPGSTRWFCVDSSGGAMELANIDNLDYTSPPSTFQCRTSYSS